MDSTNLENVREAVTKMSKNDVKRNSWILVRAYDKPVKTNHKGAGSREKNKLANKNLKKTVSEKSGYIIWKDRKVVIIYTNDLLKTPKKDFLYSSDEQDTIDGGECFGGFSKLERWDDDNNLNRSVFLSPAPIVLYNMYMNEVDLMDQRIESNIISRREREECPRFYIPMYLIFL